MVGWEEAGKYGRSGVSEGKRKEEGRLSDTSSDLIAGWLGGAVGILVSNPLEVLKVRLQTTRSRHAISALGSNISSTTLTPHAKPVPSTSSLPSSTFKDAALSPSPRAGTHHSHTLPSPRPGLKALWKAEGIKFLFAGAAGPILGLAFIDSAFFGGYGIVMKQFEQDRQNPSQLSRVFVAGATSGAMCALLETPIEVVKCRAQAEAVGVGGAKLGSFKIAKLIAKKDGLRGFYIGGLTTAAHHGLSSGIFFWGCELNCIKNPFDSGPVPPIYQTRLFADFIFRRLLKGDSLFKASEAASEFASTGTLREETSVDKGRKRKNIDSHDMDKAEIGRIMLAGGMAGSLSAIVPYPFDIIKTRLQTTNVESRVHLNSNTATPSMPAPSPTKGRLSVRQVAAGIHLDGMLAWRHRYSSTYLYLFLKTIIFPSPSLTSLGNSTLQSGNLQDGVKFLKSYTVAAQSSAEIVPSCKAEKWAVRILGLKGFLRGLKPTVVSSFVGSAVTITTFELALQFIGGDEGGAGND